MKKSPPATCPLKKPKQHKGRLEFRIPNHMWPKIEAEYAAGWTITELAARLGCNYKTLRAKFKKRGITKKISVSRTVAKERFNNLVKRPAHTELKAVAALNAKKAELMMLSPYEDSIFDDFDEEIFDITKGDY